MLYVCACGEEQKNILPALGHSSYHLVNAKEATEEENGYTGDKYCDICKKLVEYGEVIPAKKYNGLHLVNYSEPTCLEEGYSGDWVNEQGTVVIKGTVLLPLSDSHKFMLERTEDTHLHKRRLFALPVFRLRLREKGRYSGTAAP